MVKKAPPKDTSLSNNGWAGLQEPTHSSTPSFTPEQQQLLRDYVQVFSTPQGEKVLKHLISITEDSPIPIVSGNDGIQSALFSAGRVAQNELVRKIRLNITNGKNLI